ncbi:hypothetical protein KVT40_006532 [Elsinoe batatas]|uniref:phosphatidylinositol-3,4,5-trisphosphate 3-phosphatase n=1 Tax=Elsinoe batatas TaxID=2601811 RepID=A0A8K0PDW1_9PEZI|nr:hypothetical protein KVT40_006532 [Elsinoe batatas]
MASLLRQIVSGPRARHPEAGLDLCYVTDNIIATSGPSGTYPQLAYRTPLKQLVKFLDEKHGDQWAIWEFRAEGTGYPDSEVYNRIYHYPWPDHHPPPFALIPLIMGSMRNWLKGEDGKGENASSEKKERVVVVHCKAGKGRSGTVSCSYLISQEGWTVNDALARFTERRMRPGFGAGVSIPSQLRWVSYVDRWTKGGKRYVERGVEILEVHVWGLRDRVKVSVEGYVDEGRKKDVIHSFTKEERSVVREEKKGQGVLASAAQVVGQERDKRRARGKTSGEEKVPTNGMSTGESIARVEEEGALRKARTTYEDLQEEEGGGDIVFRPKDRVITPTGDVKIDFERRNKGVSGLTMITSVAHVWFNGFFEGDGPERDGHPLESDVFEMEWDKMDGIKGSSRKGTRAFDRLAVVWKAVGDAERSGTVITMPEEGEGIRDTKPADWRGGEDKDSDRDLGEEVESLASAGESRTSLTRTKETESIRRGQEEREKEVEGPGIDAA